MSSEGPSSVPVKKRKSVPKGNSQQSLLNCRKTVNKEPMWKPRKRPDRTALRAVASGTMKVIREGMYNLPHASEPIYLKNKLQLAIEQSTVFSADCSLPKSSKSFKKHAIEITGEYTLQAAQRIAKTRKNERVAVLNFASAKKPGGGFLNGSQAQEETIARSSGLYPCLTKFNKEYYELHKGGPRLIYTNTMIYSPNVPVFRDDVTTDFLSEPYQVDILTSPAPNASNGKSAEHDVIFQKRIGRVLSLAHGMGADVLVLGAWGCGVFRNKYEDVASMFADELMCCIGAFSLITFALPDARARVQFSKAFSKIGLNYTMREHSE